VLGRIQTEFAEPSIDIKSDAVTISEVQAENVRLQVIELLLRYVMLCYAMLCYVMLCCAVLCCAMLSIELESDTVTMAEVQAENMRLQVM
jgi:uncharacterized protein YerC